VDIGFFTPLLSDDEAVDVPADFSSLSNDNWC
jgi:hypothetical protein